MKVIVSFYDTAIENPLGLPDEYPRACVEVPDDYSDPIPSGSQLMTVEEFNAYKSARLDTYLACEASYIAAQE